MAKETETTLRIEILREAIERYTSYGALRSATDAERQVYSLKIAECNAMLRESGYG